MSGLGFMALPGALLCEGPHATFHCGELPADEKIQIPCSTNKGSVVSVSCCHYDADDAV